MISTGVHDTAKHENVTDIEAVAVYNEEKQEVTIFAVNRNTEEDVLFESDMRGFEGYKVKEYLALESQDMKIVNGAGASPVTPVEKKNYVMEDGIFTVEMKKCSWNVIRFGV